MKKIIMLIIASLSIFSLMTGCSNDKVTTTQTEKKQEVKKLTVAEVQDKIVVDMDYNDAIKLLKDNGVNYTTKDVSQYMKSIYITHTKVEYFFGSLDKTKFTMSDKKVH